MQVLVVLFAAAALASAFTNGVYQYEGPYQSQYGGLFGGRYGFYGSQLGDYKGLTGQDFGHVYPVNTFLSRFGQYGKYGNYKQFISKLAAQEALGSSDMYGFDKKYVGTPEILAEVGAKHALDKMEQYGQDIDSTVAKIGAVRDAEQVLDKAYQTGMIYGQGEKSHLKHVMAVAVAEHVLKTRLILGKDIGYTFAQAIAVAAAQQAFDVAELQGHDLTYAKHFAEIAVIEAIEKAQAGQFYGFGSTFVHAVAIDASNRALENAKLHGIDISSSFARAVAVAAAQQALDHFHLFGEDMGSDMARTFAVAAAQEALEDVYFGRIGSVHGILKGLFNANINDDTYYGYGFDHKDSGLYKMRNMLDQYKFGDKMPYMWSQYQGKLPNQYMGLTERYEYPTHGLKALTISKNIKKTLLTTDDSDLYKHGFYGQQGLWNKFGYPVKSMEYSPNFSGNTVDSEYYPIPTQ